MSRTLAERVRDELIPQPIIFEVDTAGQHHFATEQLPWRTVIDVQDLPVLPWIRVNYKANTITIALDGKSVIYRRRGVGFRRTEWICDLESQ